MKKSAITTLVAGAAVAAAVMGSGVANALPFPPDPTPSSLQLCGTVYRDAGATTVIDNYHGTVTPSPTTATAAAGVTVTGQLYAVGGFKVGSAVSATTNAAGEYCITGASSMPAVIAAFGYVKLSVPGAIDGPGGHGNLGTSEFAAHAVGLDSATGFNFLVP